MIYSRWRPDIGGYDYFEDARTQNVNDDLPTPRLPRGTSIGVPSVESGRPIPSDAVHVGDGRAPIGLIAPLDPRKLVKRTRPLAGISLPATWQTYALGAAVLYGAAWATYRFVRGARGRKR